MGSARFPVRHPAANRTEGPWMIIRLVFVTRGLTPRVQDQPGVVVAAKPRKPGRVNESGLEGGRHVCSQRAREDQ
jgi:hypothetical protein